MRPTPLNLHASLFIVAVIYAFSYTLSKEMMPEHIEPRGFILLRVLGALFFMGIYHFLYVRENLKNFKDVLYMAVCGFFGVALNMVMFFEGLSRTSPVHASLIMVTTPILILVIGFGIKAEKITLAKVAGIILGTIGAAMLITGAGKSDRSASVSGDIMILINAASYAIYLVIVKPLMKRYNPITIMLWNFIFGAMWIFMFDFFVQGESAWLQISNVHWGDLTFYLWMVVVFTVFCTTFLAYTLNAWALRYVPSSVLGSYVYVQPVLASLIAVSTGKYELHWAQLFYALMMFAGVYLVSKKSAEVAKPNLPTA